MDLRSLIRAQEGKAIGYVPELADHNVPITIRSADGRPNRTPFGQREAARHLGAYGGKDAIDWVMSCARLIAETASAADYHFRDDKGEKHYAHYSPTNPPGSKVVDPLLLQLFESPNPYMDWAELCELALIDYLLVGNCYWLKWRMTEDGKPLALYRLAPQYVKVVPGDFGVESYEYMVPGSGQREPLKFAAEQVLHFRAANPHSPYIGMGIIQGGARPLDLELALTDSQATYFEQKAQPSIVVQSERRVPDAVFKKLKAQLRQYQGTKQAGAMMVLEAGLKASSFSPNAHQAGFENLTKLSRDRILSMFRVPKPLLGIHDGGDQKVNEAQRVFDTKTMRPLLDKFQWAISRGITQAWGVNFVIEYDYIMPIEDRIKLAAVFASLPGVKVREIREYAGLEALGNETDEIVLNLPGEELDENGDGGFADRSLPSEAGRPPLAKNTRAFPKPGAQLPEGSAALAGKAMTLDDVATRLDRIMEKKAAVKFEKERTVVVQPPADTLLAAREAALDALVADTVLDLRDSIHDLERGLLDHVEGKAFNPSDLKARIRNSESWGAFRTSIAAGLERAVRAALSLGVMQQRQIGNETDEIIDYESVSKRVVFRPEGVDTMIRTMKKELDAKLIQALQGDANQAQVDALVREYLTAWREGKSETIALTEVTHGYNEAVLTVAEANGVDKVFVFDGDEHDQPCKDANGQVWTIEKARENRVEHPRCRRAFTPYTEA